MSLKTGKRLGFMMVGRPFPRMVEIAREAEAAGFSGLWSGDGGDCFSTITTYGLNTSRAVVGTGIAVWTRPPIIAAQAALSVNNNVGGRFVFGLGAGPRQWNEDWYGISFARPVARMREYVEVVKGVFALKPGDRFDYDGDFFNVRGYSRGMPSAQPPPVFIGTVGVQMNRLAGRLCDGVLFDVCLSPRYLREVGLPAVGEGLAKSGRTWGDFTSAVMMSCVVNPDARQAKRDVKHGMLLHLTTEYLYASWDAEGFAEETRRARERYVAGDIDGAVDCLSDEFADSISINGTPDQCRARAQEVLELVDHVALWCPVGPDGPTRPKANIEAALEAFADWSPRPR